MTRQHFASSFQLYPLHALIRVEDPIAPGWIFPQNFGDLSGEAWHEVDRQATSGEIGENGDERHFGDRFVAWNIQSQLLAAPQTDNKFLCTAASIT